MNKNTTRQYDVLDAIRSYKSANGFSPSIRDLMSLTGITSTSVVDYYLTLLESEKLIKRTYGVSRSIELLGEKLESSNRAHLIYRAIRVERDYLTAYNMRMRRN
jgi:SOS-response transcriptional repressor LexA